MTSTSPRCPNCGVAVTDDSRGCVVCKAQLVKINCLSCSGAMFAGSRFCDRCGAIAPPAKIHLEDGAGECPRCTTPLMPAAAAGTRFHECTNCDGLWTDHANFECLCTQNERQAGLLDFVSGRKITSEVLTKVRFVRCPICNTQMTRSRMAHSAGVIIDVCRQHGVWFDARELPKILEFITRRGTESPELSEKLELKIPNDGMSLGPGQFDLQQNAMDDEARRGIRKVIQALFD